MSVTYRYVRWSTSECKSGVPGLWQVSEFETRLGAVSVAWPGATTVTANGSTAGGEGPDKLIDGLTATKCHDTSNDGTVIIKFDCGAGNSVTFDGYRFATANDVATRDPDDWTVEGSDNDSDWDLLDTQTAAAVTASRQTWTADYPAAAPAAGGGSLMLLGVG
jgi:hypothetical protein